MATVRLTEADSHRRVAVSSGDVAEVRLPENPTTGFRWRAEIDPPGALVLEGDDFERTGEGGLPGAGGMRVLSFRAAAPGKVSLRLKLRRDWESGAPPQAQYDFSFDVQ